MADIAIPTCESTQQPQHVMLARARRWGIKGLSAIIDQGLISGSNFVLGIVLARWLGPDQYGAYALAFTIFILLSLVYQSLVLEPMSVYGAAKYSGYLREYSGRLLWLHVAIASATFLVMGIGAWSVAHAHVATGLPSALMGAAIAAPCVLLFWMIRRIYYLRVAPSQAAIGALLYCTAMLVGIVLLRVRHAVSPFTAYTAMAAAAAITSVFLFAGYRPVLTKRKTTLSTATVWQENWEYGRWALASAIFMWVPWNIFYTLLTAFSGMSDAGQLRALLNFALPMAQTYSAMSLLFIPYAAKSLDQQGHGDISRIAKRITLLFLAGGTAYWVAIMALRDPLIRLLYNGDYSGVGHYLPIVALASVMWGVAQGPAIALRGNKTPHLVFRMYFGAAIMALGVGVPLTRTYGLTGATVAMLVASISAWLIGCWCVRKAESDVFKRAMFVSDFA